jgi:hypothetical protein
VGNNNVLMILDDLHEVAMVKKHDGFCVHSCSNNFCSSFMRIMHIEQQFGDWAQVKGTHPSFIGSEKINFPIHGCDGYH